MGRKSLILFGILMLARSAWASWVPALGLDGGYTSLDVPGLNQSISSFGQAVVNSGPPGPYTLDENKVDNGYFVELHATLADIPVHPGLKVEYIQSEMGYGKFWFNFLGGPYVIDMRDQLTLVPVMLGLNPDLYEGGRLSIKGSANAGYSFASVNENLVNQHMGFLFRKPTGTYQARGGGFVMDAGLTLDYQVTSHWSLDLNGEYFLSPLGHLYDSNNQAFMSINGNAIDFSVKGVNLGGGLHYAF